MAALPAPPCVTFAPLPDIDGPSGRPDGRREGARGRRKDDDALRGRVRAHDPFELIRWLALSQPDPRKALAELVQNSLDAGARKIRITRLRERGLPCLKIFDDGEGVIPEMDRSEALRYIATHIGHSRKRALSPEERLKLMTQGQYGIGLLGFWSLGATLEMRTSVPGQRPHRLILHRNRPQFQIEPLRGRLPLDECWTQVVVVGLHREAMGALGGRRAADFLASELRGQLLARDVDILVEDKMSRGRAQKIVPVRPPRFLGEKLEGFTFVDVPGHPPIRMEIYLAGETGDGDDPRGLSVYCSGTLVAAGFHELAPLGLDHDPWTDPRLIGMVEFPAFNVAPGSRRGLIPDEAAGAFARALTGVEPVLAGVLENLERRRAEEIDRTLIRDLQRAFRDFYRERPRYSMLPVEPRRDQGGGPEPTAEAASGVSGDAKAREQSPPGLAATEPLSVPAEVRGRIPDLLPPGPLASVRVTPDPVRVECRGTRRARARALDAEDQAVEEPVSFSWSLKGAVGELSEIEGQPDRILLAAAEHPAEGTLSVIARSGPCEATAEVRVEILEEIASRNADEGIPEPEMVDHPGASWRSRMMEGRWQVNVGHREYRAAAERPALKLRYLAMLFAKEVVLRSSQDPRLERPLEQLVEVAAFADRNISMRGKRRSRAGGARAGAAASHGGNAIVGGASWEDASARVKDERGPDSTEANPIDEA